MEKERILKNLSGQGFTESSNIDILVWIQTSLLFSFSQEFQSTQKQSCIDFLAPDLFAQ